MHAELITVDKDILNGTPVFAGTRVPVQSLFWHLAEGISMEDFLADFPSVRKAQAKAVLKTVGLSFQDDKNLKVYENIA